MIEDSIRVILNYNNKLAAQSTRALINAAIKGNLSCVLLLLHFGVEANVIDSMTGTAPLHEAIRYDDDTLPDAKEARADRAKIVSNLIRFGADPELANIHQQVNGLVLAATCCDNYFTNCLDLQCA